MHFMNLPFQISKLEALTFILLTLISILICKYLNKEISSIHKDFILKKIIHKSKFILYSMVFFLVFSIAQISLAVKHISWPLIYITNTLITAWLASNLIHFISGKKISIWFVLFIIAPVSIFHILGVWPKVETFLSGFHFTLGAFDISLFKALKSLIIIFILFWGLTNVLSFSDKHIEKSERFKKDERMIVIQFIKIVSYAAAFFFSLQLLGVDLTVFAIFGGAIGVGIGLGLQKITANFISGFILLFEKTIKVNDLIELDGLLGFVRFTGARHTLIETYSGKEIVVPNEEFVVHKVTNWTHSHNKARLEVLVGVSYDSDLKLVKQLILSAAKECEKVAATPEPSCYLENFGDSSVNFLMYFWVDDITQGRKTPKSEVLFLIWEKFKNNGIVIPYPQRDIWIKKQPEK